MEYTAVTRELKGSTITFRSANYIAIYVNITQIAKVAGKRVSNWTRKPETKNFINFRARNAGDSYDEMIWYVSKGNQKGTFADISVALGFAKWCGEEYHDWLLGEFNSILLDRYRKTETV